MCRIGNECTAIITLGAHHITHLVRHIRKHTKVNILLTQAVEHCVFKQGEHCAAVLWVVLLALSGQAETHDDNVINVDIVGL